MNYSWKNWDNSWDHNRLSPYVHWRLSRCNFKQPEPQVASLYENADRKIEVVTQDICSIATCRSAKPQHSADSEQNDDHTGTPGLAWSTIEENYGKLGDAAFPVPHYVRNRKFNPTCLLPNDLGRLPEPPPTDSVIVGVIDTGIALGHRRLQFADGTTRILAAWQQNAPFKSDQKYLPFGQELYSQDIQRLLDKYRTGGKHFPLDEDAFNAASAVVSMRELDGHREAARRIAHGTHVLDIAAGFDPRPRGSTEDDKAYTEWLRRMPVIAVNLPTRPIVGLSGSFLEYFIMHGIARIAAISDALWFKQNESLGTSEEGDGYKILINLSFGKNADSRDGSSIFHRFLHRLNDERAKNNLRSVELIMPAGNNNLARGQARGWLKKNKEIEVRWRLSPEDRTCNYLEIWSDPTASPNSVPRPAQAEIKITPPGGHPTVGFIAGRDGQFLDLGPGVARVYCLEKKTKTGERRTQYLICTAPTYTSKPNATTAPAGVWRIAIKNCSERNLGVYYSVQSDQSTKPGSSTGLKSYFDSPDYRVFDETGRIIDTFSYRKGETKEPRDNSRYVKRHGSFNALADHKDITVIAGYRLSDGKPAPYSGTGLGFKFYEDSKAAPTASMPTDDGPAHYGIIGAGARDGSVVALRGTSFAAAQATRRIATHYLNNKELRKKSPRQILFDDARLDDPDARSVVQEVDIEKVGGGRLKPMERGYVERLSYPEPS